MPPSVVNWSSRSKNDQPTYWIREAESFAAGLRGRVPSGSAIAGLVEFPLRSAHEAGVGIEEKNIASTLAG